jgi:hypothetical protein
MMVEAGPLIAAIVIRSPKASTSSDAGAEIEAISPEALATT